MGDMRFCTKYNLTCRSNTKYDLQYWMSMYF